MPAASKATPGGNTDNDSSEDDEGSDEESESSSDDSELEGEEEEEQRKAAATGKGKRARKDKEKGAQAGGQEVDFDSFCTNFWVSERMRAIDTEHECKNYGSYGLIRMVLTPFAATTGYATV